MNGEATRQALLLKQWAQAGAIDLISQLAAME
jgi:hypothetical protein